MNETNNANLLISAQIELLMTVNAILLKESITQEQKEIAIAVVESICKQPYAGTTHRYL